MDAETQAVFEKAWDVVRRAGTPGDPQRVSGLEHALKAHAKAHPPHAPEPTKAEYLEWKKNGPDDGCRVVDQATYDLVVNAAEFVEWGTNPKQCEDYLNRFELLRLSVGQFGRVCPPPPGSPLPPDEMTTKGPDIVCSKCGAEILYDDVGHFVDCPCTKDPIVGIDPAPPNPQPIFAEFKPGDVCVLRYSQRLEREHIERLCKHWAVQAPGITIAVVDGDPVIDILRPAKGGE